MKNKNYASALEFKLNMINKEGTIFADDYGRQWKYEKDKFFFKDIRSDSKMIEGIHNMHLFGTNIRELK